MRHGRDVPQPLLGASSFGIALTALMCWRTSKQSGDVALVQWLGTEGFSSNGQSVKPAVALWKNGATSGCQPDVALTAVHAGHPEWKTTAGESSPTPHAKGR